MSGGTANCNAGSPDLTPPTDKDVADSTKELLGAMPSCSQGEFSGKVNLGPGGMLGTAKMSGSVSVGCQQIGVMVNDYSQTKSIMNCLIKSKTLTQDASASTSQKITVINYGIITGGTLSIKNVATALVTMNGDLTSDDVKTIKTALQTTVNSVMDGVQTSNKAQTSNTAGQQSIDVAKTAIKNMFEDTSVDNMIMSQFAKAKTGQEIVLENYGTIEGNVIEIGNDSVIQMTLTSVMAQGMKSAMDLTDVTDFMNNMRTTQSATSTTEAGTIMMYAAIVVGGIAVVVTIYFLVKAGLKKTDGEQHHRRRVDSGDNDDDGGGGGKIKMKRRSQHDSDE